MIALQPFTPSGFEKLIAWIDSPELLMNIAGTVFSYPLTAAQLQHYLDDPNSIAFNVIDTSRNETIGHAEIILRGNGFCKIDKLIIGDPTHRGKGIGLQVINELVNYSFTKLEAKIVELNVYDWNTAGIRCYEKAGFTANPSKNFTTQVGEISWTAINMTIDKEKWLDRDRDST